MKIKEIGTNITYRLFNKNINIKQIIIISAILVLISRLVMLVIYKINFNDSSESMIQTLSKYWDNGWYRYLISDGYNIEPSQHPAGDAANWAFFPLDAIIIKFLLSIVSMEIETAGFIINTFFLFLSIVVGFKYILVTRKSIKLGLGFSLFLAFGPYTFYFSCLYTESLYLFLTLCTLYCLKKRKYISMGIFGALVSATRNTGILLVFAIAYEYFSNFNWNKSNIKNIFITTIKNIKLIFGIAMCPIGLFMYMGYLWYLVGDPLAFMRIQKAWGRQVGNPISILTSYFRTESVLYWYFGVFFVIMVLLIIYQIKHKKLFEVIVPAIILAIQCTSSYLCIPRYMLSTGTIVIALLEYTIDKWSKGKLAAFTCMLILLSHFLLIAWFNGEWFLI